MRLGTYRLVVLAGAAAAVGLVAGTPFTAQAQAITCAPGTTVLYRAVGPQSAPMLIPAQVHATICSQNGAAVSVIPGFTTVGPAGAPMIIPVNMPVKTCVPTTTASVPVVGGGFTAPVQLVQISPGVFAVNLATPAAPVVVTTFSTALTCF